MFQYIKSLKKRALISAGGGGRDSVGFELFWRGRGEEVEEEEDEEEKVEVEMEEGEKRKEEAEREKEEEDEEEKEGGKPERGTFVRANEWRGCSWSENCHDRS